MLRPLPHIRGVRRVRRALGERPEQVRGAAPELDRATYGTLLDPANLGREYTWDLPAHLWE
ncbi:hypothetical protein AB0J19_38535, partial [Streptomyces microflavus]